MGEEQVGEIIEREEVVVVAREAEAIIEVKSE